MSFPNRTTKIFAKFKVQVVLVKDATDLPIATDNRHATISPCGFIQQRLESPVLRAPNRASVHRQRLALQETRNQFFATA